jgi:hypothetical protein
MFIIALVAMAGIPNTGTGSNAVEEWVSERFYIGGDPPANQMLLELLGNHTGEVLELQISRRNSPERERRGLLTWLTAMSNSKKLDDIKEAMANPTDE